MSERAQGLGRFRKPAVLWALVVAFSLLCGVRPLMAFQARWDKDEGFYVNRTLSLLNLPQHHVNQVFDDHGNFAAPFVSLTWIPAAGLARILSGSDDPDTQGLWLWPLLALQSLVLWLLSGMLLHYTLTAPRSRLKLPASLRRHVWLPLAIFLNLPLAYYVWTRPVMSHALEWFLAAATLAALATDRLKMALATAVMATFTRYNDAPLLLMVLGTWLDRRLESPTRMDKLPKAPSPSGRRHLWMRSVLVLALIGTICWLAYVAFVRGYGSVTLGALLKRFSTRNVEAFFLDPGWGVVWFHPWWVAALLLGLVQIRSLSWTARAAVLFMLGECGLYSCWGGPGSDFSHRYLIGSFAAAIWIYVETLHWPKAPQLHRIFIGATALNALWVTSLIFVYRTTNRTNYFVPSVNETGEGEIVVPDPFLPRAVAAFGLPDTYRFGAALTVPGTLALSWWPASDAEDFRGYRLVGPSAWITEALLTAGVLSFGIALALACGRPLKRIS